MNQVPDFVTRLQEVSSEKNGGKILFATDDFFAVAENLLKTSEPIWNDNYTEFGKWMDGWETRRKRIAGHDWTIIELAAPCIVRGACIDTAFFTGNYAPRFSLQGGFLPQEKRKIQNRNNKMGTAATGEDLKKAEELQSEDWEELISMTNLNSGTADTRCHYFNISNNNDRILTHLRLNIYPDGGIARLHIYGKPLSLNNSIKRQPLRGKCVAYSNAHFGHPDNLLNLSPSKGMHDGWETARRLDRPAEISVDDKGFLQTYGEEWAILKLEKDVFIRHIEVDTTHFKGNTPDSVKIEGAFVESGQDIKSVTWYTVLHRTKLMPNQSNGLKHPLAEPLERPINHVKVVIVPDGGLARIRIYGADA